MKSFIKVSIAICLSSICVSAFSQAKVVGADGKTYYYYPDGSVQKAPGPINNVSTATMPTPVVPPENAVTKEQKQATTNGQVQQQVINPGSVTQVIPGVVTYTPAQSYGYGYPAVTVINGTTNKNGLVGYGLGYIAGAVGR